MSVANGQIANQTTFNDAFLSRKVDSSTIGKINLQNAAHSTITDAQRELVAIARYTGKTLNTAATTAPAWASNAVGASGDSLFARIEALQTAYVGSVSGKVAGGVLFGSLQQDATRFFYNSGSGFLGIGTNAPSATVEINGGLAFVPVNVTITTGAIPTNENSFVRITVRATTDNFKTIPAPAGNGDQIKLVANITGFDLTIDDTGNINTSGKTVGLSNGGLVLFMWDKASTKWRILAGGSDTTVPITNFDQAVTTIVATASQEQIWRFTASVPEASVTLAAITFTAMPQGSKITITSQSDSAYPCVIPSNLTNVIMNGDWNGTQYSVITFQRIGPRIIEVYRNGI